MLPKDPLLCPERRTKVMSVSASGRGPQITAEEAAELERARERMLARHKLIEGMIRNNEMHLKNESARGGAEIELECAMQRGRMPGPKRKPNCKGRGRICRRFGRSISVWPPSGNGSMHPCWNLKVILRQVNTNVRGMHDGQDRHQGGGKCWAH